LSIAKAGTGRAERTPGFAMLNPGYDDRYDDRRGGLA
jgi:hypothetical protein